MYRYVDPEKVDAATLAAVNEDAAPIAVVVRPYEALLGDLGQVRVPSSGKESRLLNIKPSVRSRSMSQSNSTNNQVKSNKVLCCE